MSQHQQVSAGRCGQHMRTGQQVAAFLRSCVSLNAAEPACMLSAGKACPSHAYQLTCHPAGMESLEAVREKITELEQEAAAAKKDDEKELYLVLQKQLATLREKEVLLMKQGVLTRADSNRAQKNQLEGPEESSYWARAEFGSRRRGQGAYATTRGQGAGAEG